MLALPDLGSAEPVGFQRPLRVDLAHADNFVKRRGLLAIGEDLIVNLDVGGVGSNVVEALGSINETELKQAQFTGDKFYISAAHAESVAV